jgi:DNA invertase Pin-like site-specific DNA recombinase
LDWLVMKRIQPKAPAPTPDAAPMRIGYARVSTDEQDVDHQVQALKAAGCDHIYTDTVSGKAKNRVVLNRLLRDLRPQDTLVVTQLDRIARNIRQFYEVMDAIYGAQATFKSLKEDFDFNKSIGRFIIGILALVAQFEADLISDRTKSGMAAAKARGAQIGQTKIFTDAMRAKVIKLWTARARGGKWKYSTREVARMLKISTSLINNRLPGGREAYFVKPKRKPR